MKIALLSFIALTLAGCSTPDTTQCRSANWYDVGFRDALFGLQRQDDVYSARCGQAAQIDVARYAAGWREGRYEFNQRTIHGGTD